METLLSDGRSYLVGDSFSVADAYFFVVANWSGHTGIDLERWPHVAAYQRRIAARETVQAALKDRKSAVSGESVAGRLDLGGRRIIEKKNRIVHESCINKN